MIDEKKLIEEIRLYVINVLRQDTSNEEKLSNEDVLGDVIIKIRNQAKIKGWIPCSERLPDKTGRYYIVSVKSIASDMEYTRPALYDNDGFSTKIDEWVVAWQPLPEPYKGEVKRNLF